MNWKKFFFAFIAAFIFMFLWGWLFNQVFMKDIYAQTASLWRPQTEMMNRFPWLVIGQLILVGAFVLIFLAAADWALNVRVRGGNCTDSRRAWVSHAGGMGIPRRHLAFMAAARRDQFPGIV
jgi:hypothetical protein